MEPEPGNAGAGRQSIAGPASGFGGGFDFMDDGIEITVNGKPLALGAEISLGQFMQERRIPEASVVERNGQIIPRDRRHLVILRDGDVLEIVRLVGGG